VTSPATPRPWTVEEWTHYAEPRRKRYRVRYTATDDMNRGAQYALADVEAFGPEGSTETDEANAHLIVTAVNAHSALLERVALLEGLLREACDLAGTLARLDRPRDWERLTIIRAELGEKP
jgi:hypothetical protein